MKPADLLADPWACGPFCWVIDDVRLLPEPIPCRGAQGLWQVPLPEAHRLAELLFVASIRSHAQSAGWQALTVLQPFATAIALGPKRVENRPWRWRIPPDGVWLGLHAGKALAGTQEEVDDALEDWRFERWPETPALADMPRGAMLGAMHIAAIVPYPEGA